MYTIFVRNWWKMENGKKVPNPGARRTKIGTAKTAEEAREKCRQWNDNNPEGKLSRKAEFTSDY